MADEQLMAELKDRIEKICKEKSIKVCWLEQSGIDVNHASKSEQKIWVYQIADKGDFVSALHEIGHTQCDPDNKPRTAREILDVECNAWKWVLDNYREELDRDCWKRLYRSLKQYKDKVNGLPEDHPVHGLLNEAKTVVPEVDPYRDLNLFRSAPPKKGK